ncbi:MAG: ParB N-terminal domain-containing protein [Planctomycetaceae bacterium]|jgi:DNA modification methylase|nr:ParB N-terminal domain-containing protein [Planctomycetaceae bacterium]
MSINFNIPDSNFHVEVRDINSIRPYERNPRLNDKAIDAVVKSLREFGFRQPIVVDGDGVIIAGHTRYKAALKLSLQKIPVHVATDLTPEQVKAYRIADNKTGEIAEWDFDILPIELSELRDDGFELDILAFNEKELTQLLNVDISHGKTDPDSVPAPPDDAITQRGDIWILGNHRLMCGDSADVEDFNLLLAGNKIQLVNTDPPYNVKVEPRSNNAVAAGLSSFTATHHQCFDVARDPDKTRRTSKKLRAKDRPLANDFVSDEEFNRLLDAWFGNIVRVLDAGRSAYIWGGYANLANYPTYLKKHGLYFSQCIVWNKLHPVLTRKDFMGAYEICFYCWKEGAAHKFFGANNIQDLWEVKKIAPQNMVHLTEKPVELAVRAIQYSSKPNENVLELFGGSGSTLIACEQTNRNCFAMEIDQLYCDVIVKRWEEFTGQKAERIPHV